jgi:uncharacterized protein (TIGR03437 family)
MGLGNLWLLGGEIIRDLHYDPALRKRAPERLLCSVIHEDGGPLLHNGTEEEQRSSTPLAANSADSSLNPSAGPAKPANSPDEATNEAKRHAIRPRNIDSTSILLASGVPESTVVLVRILSCLALLNAAVMAAQPGFLLGADYSEWLYPNAGQMQIATDGSGALYILSVLPGTSLSSQPVFRVTKLSADGKTILWENDLGFATDQIAVDPSGGVYVLSSISAVAPLVPPATSLFVAKLTADGGGIAWKTQVPNLPQYVPEPVLAVDPQGRAYVAGESDASNAVGGVVRLKADGSGIDYTAKVAGYPTAIAVDASGGAFVAGSAVSSPTDVSNSFLARLAPDGSAGYYLTLPAALFGIVVTVDPQGNAVTYSGAGNEGGVLQRFDSKGAVTLSQPGPKSLFPALAVDAAGNMYVTGSTQFLTPVRNSLATCGLDLLSVFAPDGSVLQTTYIPGGHNSGALVAIGVNSNVFVVDRAEVGFTPSQTGPFPPVPAVPPANPDATTPFLWRLSPNANAQTFPLACLGNAATYNSSSLVIAPGTMVSLFGNGLGPQQGIQTQATLQSPFPTQAGNVEVTFDGNQAPLIWVQDAQINAVAPWSLMPGQTTQVCVSYQNVKTNCLTVPVAQTSPGVFTIDGVHAAALNQDGTINSADHPSPVGSIISVWATGLGPIDPAQGDGTLVGFPLPTNTAQVAVQAIAVEIGLFGGPQTIITPFAVTYAGPAPYLVAGTSQINFQVVKYAGTIMVGNGFQIYVAP